MLQFLLAGRPASEIAFAQELFDSVTLGVILQGTDGAVVAANAAACSILGVSRQELQEWTGDDPRWRWLDADAVEVPPSEQPGMAALRAGRPIAGVVMRAFNERAAEYRWLQMNAVPIYGGFATPLGVYTIFEDITDRRNVLVSLHDRIAQQAAVVELQRMAMSGAQTSALMARAAELSCSTLGADRAGVLLLDDDELRFAASYGWEPEATRVPVPARGDASQAAYTLRVNDVVIVNDLGRETRFSVHHVLGSRGVASGISAPIAGRQGAAGVLGVHSTSPRHFTGDAGDFLRSVAAVIGTSLEKERIERALHDNQSLLRAVVEGSGDVVTIKDLEGRYIFSNNDAARRVSLTSDEMIGKTDEDLFPSEIAGTLTEMDRQVVESGRRLVYEQSFGVKIPGVYSVLKVPLSQADGRTAGVITVARDITERRRLEEQLRQTQKLEAIGRLAGGIAHDFNNLLTIILGYADLLASQGAVSSHAEPVKEIKAAAERAALLTSQLLAFGRQQVLQPKVIQPNWVVANMDRMLRRIIGEDITLATRLGTDAGNVKVDPGQLEQVLLNIAINARDAMPNGGTLTIETANVDAASESPCGQEEIKDGRYVMIALSDTGCGMDRETLARCFEPFFTTKGSKGTGLGLATVYGVVEQSGGHVFAYSEPGVGSTFKVHLPLVDERPDRMPERSDVLSTGRERILVVEDERPVRELLARSLRRFGYEVWEAEDGSRALDLLREERPELDLVITDVVMPNMGGRDLAAALHEQYPQLRVLLMSGYADGGAFSGGLVQPGEYFLQKPFTVESLTFKVRDVLDHGWPCQ
jgi:PAS domain S-box-containing protein